MQFIDVIAKTEQKNLQFHRIRYNLYGILIYWTYLIIPRKAGSSEPVFFFFRHNKGATAPVDYSSTFATAPFYGPEGSRTNK